MLCGEIWYSKNLQINGNDLACIHRQVEDMERGGGGVVSGKDLPPLSLS